VRLKKPASDGRYDPLRATLAFTSLAGAEPPLPKEKELSLRAHSLSGIALSPGRSADETVVAWAGVEAGQPQVFLTRLGPDGARREQRMLTRKQGGLSDVGIVAVDGGHVVGWLDERSGAPQLYSARVSQALNRVGGEQRPKTSGDSPAELSLASLGSLVLAVWSDASGEDRADLFGRILSPKDASPLGDEIRLSETTQHSFSPALCPRGDETVVAWLERAVAGEGGHAAMLGVLGVDGNWKESPERVAFEGGTPAALGLDCSAAATRVAVLVESSDRWGLSVFERTGGRTGSPKVVLRLTRGARGALRPVVRGDQIYLADAAPGGGDRIRRLRLVWR
jgi:hypothetical protein